MHLTRIEILGDSFPRSGTYPFSLEVLRRTCGLEFPGPVTFFAGENGSGKSTLLEAISLRCGIKIQEFAPPYGKKFRDIPELIGSPSLEKSLLPREKARFGRLSTSP